MRADQARPSTRTIFSIPGKIIADGRFKIDSHLRLGAGYSIETAVRAGAGVCGQGRLVRRQPRTVQRLRRLPKETPTMCPTFVATGEEIMSTRGRANAIRAALELRGSRAPIRCARRNWKRR